MHRAQLLRLREAFWILLAPFSWLWAAVTWLRRRLARAPGSAEIPVICFGNLHDGGTGKTPLVLACVQRFAKQRPVVVSRGYGGSETVRVALVEPNTADAARRFGDEPVLLAARGAKVVIGRDRAKAIAFAASQHQAGWAVLDDGFQRLSVRKNFAAVVVPGDRSPWDAWCWPAGSLREPLSAAKFADAIVLTAWPGEETQLEQWDTVFQDLCPKVARYRAQGRVEAVRDPATGKECILPAAVAALCAIGAPGRFFAAIRSCTHVTYEQAFADHHPFSREELRVFSEAAQQSGASLIVTTAKDWPRLAPLQQHLTLPTRILEIGYDVPESFWQHLEQRVGETL